jgi:large conductance mechanosensitive channel
MSLLKEFKAFAMRGNVVDLAVAVIIGGAFGRIVTSLVNDIIMPPIGVLLGGVDFKDLVLVIKKASEGVDAVTMNYGMFLQNIIDFIIIAFAIFMIIRGINSLRKKEAEKPAEPPAPTMQEKLLTEIRDLLKK